MAVVSTRTVTSLSGEFEFDKTALSSTAAMALADRFGWDTTNQADAAKAQKLITEVDPVIAVNVQVTDNTFTIDGGADYTGIHVIINNADDKMAFTYRMSEVTDDTSFVMAFDDTDEGSVTLAISLRDFQVTGGYSDRVNRTSPSGDLIGPARLNIFGGVNKAAAADRAALNNNAHVGKTLYAPQEGVKDWRDEAFDSAVQGQDNWGTLAHAQDNPIDGTATHVTNAKSKNGKGDGHTGVDVDNE